MLKPDIANQAQVVESIREMIAEAGLTIEREERCKLSRILCEEFYAEHSERPFCKDLVSFISSGSVIKLELAGDNAIGRWRQLIGPTNSATVGRKSNTLSRMPMFSIAVSLAVCPSLGVLSVVRPWQARAEVPDSIRAKFGTDNQRNAAHGSDSAAAAERELKLMFKG